MAEIKFPVSAVATTVDDVAKSNDHTDELAPAGRRIAITLLYAGVRREVAIAAPSPYVSRTALPRAKALADLDPT